MSRGRNLFGAPVAGWVLLAALSAHAPRAGAQDVANFQVFQTDLPGAVALASPPGDPQRIMIAQLSGVIRVVENGVLLPTPFLDIRSRIYPFHGLIGMAFPPDYTSSHRFYINYTFLAGEGDPRIARYTTSANPNIANTTEEVLLDTGNGGGDHNAGWMEFGRDGYLYIARGDAVRQANEPQDPNLFQGKILRLDVSTPSGYAVPPDNPYVGIDGLDEIIAIGVRNPWRNGFDTLNGDLFIADVGSDLREEINYVPAGTLGGRNFGWPCMEGLLCRDPAPPCLCAPSMTLPIYSYDRGEGFIVIGGPVYRGSAIPRWRGRYFFLDGGTNRIWSFVVIHGALTDMQEHTAALNNALPPGQPLAGAVAFGTDAAGEMYVLELAGRILKIVPQFAPADWNRDTTVNSSDFFDFLIDFFADNADINGDHVTNSADLFEFFILFFTS